MFNNDFFRDPENALVRPYNDTLIIDSHGSKIYARIHIPAFYDETSRCPVVLMLHGYPGNEKNIDIAQNLRMAGYATVTFSYRGVWGSHGEYTFAHLIEDTLVVAQHIRDNAEEFRFDTGRFYVLGHSMGGFAAVNSLAAGLEVSGAILMAPCNMAYKYLYNKESFDTLMSSQKNGYFNTPSDTYLEEEVQEHAQQWLFENAADKLDLTITYGFIGGKLDGLTPPEEHAKPLYEILVSRGADAKYTELDDGHDFPASRVALTNQIIFYLREMEKKQDEKH
ncbi:MAG: alpha/beta fold hydrolase [Firmicutes bacterium]|nr:alpha/beta fold hydrolase [Bacillota bacterium]